MQSDVVDWLRGVLELGTGTDRVRAAQVLFVLGEYGCNEAWRVLRKFAEAKPNQHEKALRRRNLRARNFNRG